MMQFDFSRNYFELLGITADYEMDKDKLFQAYQLLQEEFHPDRYVNASDQDRRMAMQATTFINKAYQTLKDDQMRARYLLELHGVTFNEEKDTTQDMEFLTKQMELREQIDEVDQQEDPLDYLDELISKARQQKQQIIRDYRQFLAQQEWPQAKDAVLKLQYFSRLQQQIDRKQEQLEGDLL